MIEAERMALRRRYAQERDKRLRPDGNGQYLEFKGRFSRMLEDPYTARARRQPRRDHVRVAFVGGGFAGLVTGAGLKQAGVEDVRIVENGGGFGGTWYWNRYPGAQWDTSAMIYMPLLEETGHVPSDCTPGYYNNEGHFDAQQFLLGGYHKGAPAYFRYIDQWRKSGDFAGLEFSRR